MIGLLLAGLIYAEVYVNENVFEYAQFYGHAIGEKKSVTLHETYPNAPNIQKEKEKAPVSTEDNLNILKNKLLRLK